MKYLLSHNNVQVLKEFHDVEPTPTKFTYRTWPFLMNFRLHFQGKESEYDVEDSFQCLKCAPGCESCDDYSPCIASLNWVLRTILLVLQCIIIASLSIVVLFTIKYKEIKVGGTNVDKVVLYTFG